MTVRETVAAYRAAHGENLSESQDSALVALAENERMHQAWSMLDRHVKVKPFPVSRVAALIHAILEAHAVARASEQMSDVRASRAARNRRLQSAAADLAAYFESVPIPDEYGPLAPESGKQFDQQVRDCRRSFEWARTFLSAMACIEDQAIGAHSHHSQKRNRPEVTFSVLLCDRMLMRLGQPHYGFVAIAAEVLFDLDESLDEDLVRKAWQRHTEKRARST